MPTASPGTPSANIHDLAGIPEPSKALFPVFGVDAFVPLPLGLRGRIALLELGERQRELRSSNGVAGFDPGIGSTDMRHVVRVFLRIVTAELVANINKVAGYHRCAAFLDGCGGGGMLDFD